MKLDSTSLDRALGFLAERLAARGAEPMQLVVCGGSGLIALRLVNRSTQDVDVLGRLGANADVVEARPFPKELVKAAAEVAEELGLPERWLNAGPADQLKAGLPAGFATRLVAKRYGPALTVNFASRWDQIHLKLFAALDQGPGRHVSDLQTLKPAPREMEAAARWVLTQDEGPEYPQAVRNALKALGYEDVAQKL